AIGKLLGPALALGLMLFATNLRRLTDVIKTWTMFAMTLVPLLVFNLHHPGSLQARFHLLTYITPQSTTGQIAVEFSHHYLANLDLVHWVYIGDGNPRHHVPRAMGSLLGATVLIAIIGFFVVLFREWRNPWWRYVLFGLGLSLVPGALTRDDFHALREIAFPIFLLILNIPALVWLLDFESDGNSVRRAGDGWALAI